MTAPRWVHRDVPGLEAVLVSWLGTPYGEGQRTKHGAVDCVGFVSRVLDELRGRDTDYTTLPPDAALHAPERARAALRVLRRAHEPAELVEDGTLEPGDVVVWAPLHGGPGHATIAGSRRYELWEAGPTGVRRVGVGALIATGLWRLTHVYRATDKASWRAREGA